jgi:signal transduction histidine kinase
MLDILADRAGRGMSLRTQLAGEYARPRIRPHDALGVGQPIARSVSPVTDAPADQRGTEAFEVPLWRALAVFRLAAFAYAVLLVALKFTSFAHPVAGWCVIAVMAAWTAVTAYGYARPRWRGWPLLVSDLVVTAGCLLISPLVLGADGARVGIANIPVAWIAGPVLAWAISGGRRRGAVAAVVMGVCHLTAWGRIAERSLDGAVLLLLAGVAVGHVARLAVEAQRRLQRAVDLEARTRERGRLARDIHDSVLQVLALVQRRGAEVGGEAGELGRLAGEQEAALRALVSDIGPAVPGDPVDLRALLGRHASASVSLAVPAGAVWLPAGRAGELAAAVGAALANVRRHCGTDPRAWLLVESDDDAVTVTVRDDGPGIAPGRLPQAAAEGRLGIARSIEGRMRDLGGTAVITSTLGQGTEVELRVPRTGAPVSLS